VIASLQQPDIIVVAGGSSTQQQLADIEVLAWLTAADATSTWTTSVCTGSLLLGAAGLLRGRRATSHWYELESLSSFGAQPVAERVVQDGKYLTAAGVSAGIDMALQLIDRITGPAYTQGVQLNLEYDPQPPYDSGSIAKARPEIADRTREAMQLYYGPTWSERQRAPEDSMSSPRVATDPVCRMTPQTEVSRAKGLHSLYKGTDYFFCGKGCQLEFAEDPDRFLAPGYLPSM
jgi:YHS domain-containing protein